MSKNKHSPSSRLRKGIFLFLLVIVVPFGCGELLVRSLGDYDVDGAFAFFGRVIPPYRLPRTSVQLRLSEYFGRPHSYIVDDDQLGWTIRPSAKSDDGLYASNSVGLRSATEILPKKPAETFRVALFGDSFTHGDEITIEQTWGYFLEQKLRAGSPQAQVVNFGVPGYGVDQALLRWQLMGREYQPDVVVLGLCLESIARCVNVLRPLYLRQTGIPFSKPRFVLKSDSLQLVNSPVIPPDQLPVLLEDFAGSELASYEHHFVPKNFIRQWWSASKLVCVAREALSPAATDDPQSLYDPQGEPRRLFLAILAEFERQVTADGSEFVIVYLPWMSDLIALQQNQFRTQQAILAEVEQITATIRPEKRLLASGEGPRLFATIHYSERANRIVADVVAKKLVE